MAFDEFFTLLPSQWSAERTIVFSSMGVNVNPVIVNNSIMITAVNTLLNEANGYARLKPVPANRRSPMLNSSRVMSEALFKLEAALIEAATLLDSDADNPPMPTLLDEPVLLEVLLLLDKAVRFISRSIQATSNPTTAFCASVKVAVLEPATPVISAMDVPAKALT